MKKPIVQQIYLLCLMFFCIRTTCNGQEIVNVDFNLHNEQIKITYDIINCPEKAQINKNVYVVFESENGELIFPQAMKGDFTNVNCGKNKTIFWNAINDSADLRGTFRALLSFERAILKATTETKAIKVGNQYWMNQDLKISKYNNGDPINTNLNHDDWNNTISGAYFISPQTNRFFYNHYAVTDTRGLCPTGWRIPSKSDWNTLIKLASANSDTLNLGLQLKETSKILIELNLQRAYVIEDNYALTENYKNTPETNSDDYPRFWWSTTSVNLKEAFSRLFEVNSREAVSGISNRNNGFAVRCIKNIE